MRHIRAAPPRTSILANYVETLMWSLAVYAGHDFDYDFANFCKVNLIFQN